jgi:hypothetical protein
VKRESRTVILKCSPLDFVEPPARHAARAGNRAVEGLLWAVSIVLYVRIPKAGNRAGVFGFWGMIVLLSALWIVSLGGAPPPGLLAVGIVNAVLGLVTLAWAYWINTLRPPRT